MEGYIAIIHSTYYTYAFFLLWQIPQSDSIYHRNAQKSNHSVALYNKLENEVFRLLQLQQQTTGIAEGSCLIESHREAKTGAEAAPGKGESSLSARKACSPTAVRKAALEPSRDVHDRFYHSEAA